jgi:dTMP kinase
MLIAFEGLPGAGKTTQGRLLTTRLRDAGVPVTYLPDNLTRPAEPLGQTLLELFDSGDPFARHDSVLTDTSLAAALRADILATHITPALTAGHVVVEDRGLHTMYSYSLATLRQRHRVPPDPAIAWLRAVGALAGRGADHAVWLRLPAEHAIARATARQGHPYRTEQVSYLHHVHDAYTDLARNEPTLTPIDVAGRTVDDVHTAVLDTLHTAGALPEPTDTARPVPPERPVG